MGTSYWIKHDVIFLFRESSCISKQASSFPQRFCGFPGSLGPVVLRVEPMEPGEITTDLPAMLLHTQTEKCWYQTAHPALFCDPSCQESFRRFPSPRGADRRAKKAQTEEALFYLISCNFSCLLASTCPTQTQAAQVLHLYRDVLRN